MSPGYSTLFAMKMRIVAWEKSGFVMKENNKYLDHDECILKKNIAVGVDTCAIGYIRRYYMLTDEIRENPEAEGIRDRILAMLDSDRREKSEHIKAIAAKDESLCAGLLLQRSYDDYLRQPETETDWIRISPLNMLEMQRRGTFQTHQIGYRYGEKGKPYFAGIPLFFSLSHSDGKVILAVSDKEIGADIQAVRKVFANRLVERFFSPDEKQEWKVMDEVQRQEFFYRSWTRKEALGKLTGLGVNGYLEENPFTQKEDIRWEEYRIEDAYVALCIRV